MAKTVDFKCKVCGAVHIFEENEDGTFNVKMKVEVDDVNGTGTESGEKSGTGKKRESFFDFIARLNRE